MNMRNVEKMTRSGLSQDGSSAILTFALKNEETIELEFSILALASMVQDLGPVLTLARERSEPNKQGVVAAQPAQYRAGTTDDGKQVLLSLRLQNGLESHFAFGPRDALDLGQKILDAAKPRKRRKPRGRH